MGILQVKFYTITSVKCGSAKSVIRIRIDSSNQHTLGVNQEIKVTSEQQKPMMLLRRCGYHFFL